MQIEFPGLFDLQVNGFSGVDFNNPSATPEDVQRAIEEHAPDRGDALSGDAGHVLV